MKLLTSYHGKKLIEDLFEKTGESGWLAPVFGMPVVVYPQIPDNRAILVDSVTGQVLKVIDLDKPSDETKPEESK